MALYDELLGYARSGLAGTPQKPVALALKTLVERIVAAEGVAGRVTLAIPGDLSVRADPKLLERAHANLARNFLRHTPATARLTLTARHEDGRVALAIVDDGPGVPADILTRPAPPTSPATDSASPSCAPAWPPAAARWPFAPRSPGASWQKLRCPAPDTPLRRWRS